MRLCLLSARFPPQRCGVGDYTYFLACALAEMGHEVDVLTAVGEVDEALYPIPPKVHVHRVIESWGTRGLPSVIDSLRSLDSDTLLIQYTPHSFDRRGITLAINLLPILLRATRNIRLVTNFHELYIPFDHSLRHSLGAAWQRSAAVLLASGSHALSVTAIEWQRRLRRIGIRKPIELIPVGSNIPLATISEEDRATLRLQLLRETEGLLLAGFGALHDRDVSATLSGLRKLKRYGPAKLIWIGGGNPDAGLRASIERAIKANGLRDDDVEWTGILPHPQVSRLLSACDVMALPFVDGVSTRRTSAVTAAQHSLPVLTTTGKRLEACFIHGRNVYLVPAGDSDALSEGLVELALKPDLRACLAQGGRELFETHFAWHTIAEHVARLTESGSLS